MPNKTRGGVTLRAVLIGLAFAPLNVYLVVQWETVWGTQYPTTMSIFFNAVFVLFLLTALNALLRRTLPLRKGARPCALTQGELLTVYIVLNAAVAVSGHDFSQTLFATLGSARWFATPENEWDRLFWHYQPGWLTVSDPRVLRGFFEGDTSLYTRTHFFGWLSPMLGWTVFLSVLVFTMLCLNVLVRRQWIEREKLTYPVVRLPYEMTVEETLHGAGFWKSRLLWVGFGVGAGIDVLNGVSFLYPTIPSIPLMVNLGPHLTEKPWNAVGDLKLQVNPYAIGLAFPIPLALLLSVWVYFFVWKAERVIGAALGVNVPGYPFEDQQLLGGYLAIATLAIWKVRPLLVHIVRGKVLTASQDMDSSEPMSERAAVFGLVGGLLFITFFLTIAGMTAWFAFLFFAVYLGILFGFTRLRAEIGPPLTGIHYSGPLQLIVAVLGSRRIPLQTLTVAAPFWTMTKEIRNNPMPFQLESFKLAQMARMNARRLTWAILAASVFGAWMTFLFFAQVNYSYGGPAAWRGVTAFNIVERWVVRPTETDWTFLSATAVGAVVVLINTALRLRFLWWELHPLGYVLAGYYHFERLWFPILLAWLSKRLILSHSGIRGYQRALPLFLGFVLGEFVVGSIWGILGLATQTRMYAFKDW